MDQLGLAAASGPVPEEAKPRHFSAHPPRPLRIPAHSAAAAPASLWAPRPAAAWAPSLDPRAPHSRPRFRCHGPQGHPCLCWAVSQTTPPPARAIPIPRPALFSGGPAHGDLLACAFLSRSVGACIPGRQGLGCPLLGPAAAEVPGNAGARVPCVEQMKGGSPPGSRGCWGRHAAVGNPEPRNPQSLLPSQL